jgi:hypothetical protein
MRCIKYGLELHPMPNAARMLKWLLSGELSIRDAGRYLSVLMPGPGEGVDHMMRTAARRRSGHRHHAE